MGDSGLEEEDRQAGRQGGGSFWRKLGIGIQGWAFLLLWTSIVEKH
jgi:hypothetical protein